MERRKILIIDDSEITLAMEKSVLEARGYEVQAAATLQEFEKLLKAFRPHLILTDIHMPEAKGTDICRTLKNEYGTQDIPIVLFSSLNDEELEKKVARFRDAAAKMGRDIPISLVTFGDPTPATLHHYRELGIVRTIIGASRVGWDDPATTLPFIDRYTPLIPDLA